MNYFKHIGDYFLLMLKVFARPERHIIYFRQTLKEIENLGLSSIGIVTIISIFMGGIVTLQIHYNLVNPLFPRYLIGVGNRDILILEFSSTILGLMMAGKIGSNIATEIGSMRISEQIESLEIMGVNSAGYLILPKVIAVVFISPILFILSVFFGLIGGLIAGPGAGIITVIQYLDGVQYLFVPFYVKFSIIKSLVFGFIISSVPAYFGYNVKGGALEVGKTSTQSVVNSSILILFFDLIITQLFFK